MLDAINTVKNKELELNVPDQAKFLIFRIAETAPQPKQYLEGNTDVWIDPLTAPLALTDSSSSGSRGSDSGSDSDSASESDSDSDSDADSAEKENFKVGPESDYTETEIVKKMEPDSDSAETEILKKMEED
ncbi:hypothetical protein, partial [Salmonella enterica]|uniref:hypothetical protein n=1 Tax=Salmonella enterica TaxID=28901 RepID=UPI001429060C